MYSKRLGASAGLVAFALIFSCSAVILSYLFSTLSRHTPSAENTPTSESPGLTVIIDAGHGGEDGGTQSADGLLEKDVNLAVAKDLEALLRASGVNVIMTRSDDTLLYDRNENYQGHKKSLDLAARLKIANETPNAILVSIHANSFPISKYSGLQVYYSQNNEDSFKLAKAIQDDAKEFLGGENDRKIKAATSSIYLLDRATSPAVLVECGFLSNPGEAALLSTEAYQQKVAFSLFCSVIKYIDSEARLEL